MPEPLRQALAADVRRIIAQWNREPKMIHQMPVVTNRAATAAKELGFAFPPLEIHEHGNISQHHVGVTISGPYERGLYFCLYYVDKANAFYQPIPDRLRDRLGSLLAQWVDELETAAPRAVKPDPQQGAVAPKGFAGPTELATEWAVDPEAARGALNRWRKKNAGGNGYVQNTDRRPNEPEFIYDRAVVSHVMDDLKSRTERREIRRTKTSGQRPAEKI